MVAGGKPTALPDAADPARVRSARGRDLRVRRRRRELLRREAQGGRSGRRGAVPPRTVAGARQPGAPPGAAAKGKKDRGAAGGQAAPEAQDRKAGHAAGARRHAEKQSREEK